MTYIIIEDMTIIASLLVSALLKLTDFTISLQLSFNFKQEIVILSWKSKMWSTKANMPDVAQNHE